MEVSTFLWTTFAAFLTLATFSFLYKDNPFYKFAEHLVVGVSAGYFVIILWHNNLVPNLFGRLADGHWYALWLDSSKPWYVVPLILGLLMFTRFNKKWTWVSRYPMALYIGISAGLAVPLELSNRINKQLFATMATIDWSNFFGRGLLDYTSGFAMVIIFLGVVASLMYFFFSKAHTGLFGGVAKFGIWILMIGFGATFGFTVMARISLFINRLQFLRRSWMDVAFDSSNANHATFQLAFWGMVGLVLVYIVYELAKKLMRRSEA
jgi:hypothetical protein